MTAMGEQVEVSDTQMQFLQKKALIQRAIGELAITAAKIAIKNSKMLAAIFSDEKFFTVRKIIIKKYI